MTAEAALAGAPASLAEAVKAAAGLLGRARAVAVAGLDADVAAVGQAIRLARRLGASVDHAHAAAALCDLAVMREAGWIVTTPLQARARADLVLLVGDGLEAAWPEMGERLALDRAPTLFPERARTVLRLPGSGNGLLAQLSLLRARGAGRVGVTVPDALGAIAARLTEARYGVAVWAATFRGGPPPGAARHPPPLGEGESAIPSPNGGGWRAAPGGGGPGPLAIEMLCGLIDDLNATTRWAGLPLPAPGNAAGAMQAAAWLTGLPLPLGFAWPGGPPRHDPWRFDAARRVARGEADAVLWVSAGAPAPPPWSRAVPTVALTAAGTRFAAVPEVTITVGRPGVDHDAVLFDPALGALAARAARAPGSAPRAAEVLAAIAAALPC